MSSNLALTGRLKIRHRAFNEVTGIVQFVPVAEIRPFARRNQDREIRIQIAIFLLRAFNRIDQFIGNSFERGVRVRRQTVRDRLQPFSGVRIPKHVHDRTLSRYLMCAYTGPCFDPAGVFQLAINRGNRPLAIYSFGAPPRIQRQLPPDSAEQV